MELDMAEMLLGTAFGSVLPYACVAAGEWLRGRLIRHRLATHYG